MAAASTDLNQHPDVIDMNVFEQILEMDDDQEERDFSKDIVIGFFDQTEQTLEKMNEAHNEKDLEQLSALGHFLKGSSATLGLVKLQRTCEQIQNYGKGLDATGSSNIHNLDQSLSLIKTCLDGADKEFREARTLLTSFFGISE